MTTIRKLALVLCLVCLFTSYSNSQDLTPGQVYTTPNIVLTPTTSGASSWTGAVNQNSLTCWGGGDPGYCGPAPITLPSGVIHFSYGSSYIFQQQAVANVLPQLTGIQVTGFNFRFNAKNGNGWDDGRTDQLTALVRFWDTSGGRGTANLLERREYNLNYKFDWTTFNYSENFTSPLSANKIGQVQYGFLGRDNNGWAGPYGPEIHSVNFSLKYGVDPCQSDPLSSPTCPGYLAALAKLLPPPVVQEPVVVVAEPLQQTQQETVAVLTATVSAAPQTSQPQQSAPQQTTASAPQQERSSSGPGLGFALNLISRNADRERTLVQQVTQQAIQEAAASGAQAAQQAVNIAATSATQSQELTPLQLPGLATALGSSTRTQIQQAIQANPILVQQQQQQQTNSGRVAAAVTETPQVVFVVPQQSTAAQTEQTGGQLSSNFLTDVTNPLRSILESIPQPVAESTVQTVRSNVQDSSLAGGVQLSSLGGLPQGYAGYLQLQLQDAKFYDSKPIYQNQRVVDNVRVLRGLGSDALHQRLVDSQYK